MNSRLKVTTAFILLAMFIALCACGDSSVAATIQPVPTQTIPAGFDKYTDQSISFSVHYPDVWSIKRSRMESVDEFLDQNPLDEEFRDTATIFSAGDDRDGWYEPNVVINVEAALPEFDSNEYSEAGIQAAQNVSTSFQIASQRSVQIGDISAQLIEWSYDSAEFNPDDTGRWTIVAMSIKRIGDVTGWQVACGYGEFAPPSSRETCDSVVTSFRLIN
jgi:hypothetical protein